jgi:glycosyltransferase involved in cell wall biosynthesis
VTGAGPLVSIVIPAFNAERWLAQAVKSALEQTWPWKEIIVVNDGSWDATKAVAASFQSAAVRVVDQPHRGAAAARNQGFRRSRGKFIQYLDADDLLDPRKIEVQLRRLTREGPGYVALGAWGRFEGDPRTARFLAGPAWADLPPVEWLVCSWTGGGMMHPAAWLVPREVVERAGPWDETLTLNDDGEFFCRALLQSRGVRFCADARSYYRSGVAGTLSGSRSPAAYQSAWRATQSCVRHLLAVQDDRRTRRAAADSFQRLAYALHPDAPDLVRRAEARARQLGGSKLPCDGGSTFRLVRSLVGWKVARRLQRLRHLAASS